MTFTRATYHFATVPGVCQAATLYVHTDGYPSGAATLLHAMLLEAGASHARAFQLAHQLCAYVAKDNQGDATTSFRYLINEFEIVAEERCKPGVEQWETIYSGALLDFIRESCTCPLLHATGPREEGATNFSTLATLESYLAEAQREAIRYEAGVWGVGAGPEALDRVAQLRKQVLSALRAEAAAGRESYS